MWQSNFQLSSFFLSFFDFSVLRVPPLFFVPSYPVDPPPSCHILLFLRSIPSPSGYPVSSSPCKSLPKIPSILLNDFPDAFVRLEAGIVFSEEEAPGQSLYLEPRGDCMKLTVGALAPVFATEDVFGRSITLSSFQGQPVLLSFFRNAACALCNLQVHKLIQAYPSLQEAGLSILAVFESPRENVLRHVERQKVPFPLVADPEARLYDLYAVETSPEKVAAAVAEMDKTWMKDLVMEAKNIGYELMHEEGSNFNRLPAEFLIGGSGRIEAAFYSERPGFHISFQEIDKFLAHQHESSLRQPTRN